MGKKSKKSTKKKSGKIAIAAASSGARQQASRPAENEGNVQTAIQNVVQMAIDNQGEQPNTRRRLSSIKRGETALARQLFESPPRPLAPALLTGETRTQIMKMAHAAVDSVARRGFPTNVGINDKKTLKKSIWRVMDNEYTLWLTIPLLVGLMGDARQLNSRVKAPSFPEALPVLHWICQYRLLETQLGYQGKDDMIALAIDAGVDLRSKGSNGTNALFFATKYASPVGVSLLIEAGIQMDIRDCFGQTLWKNATEYPNPDIVEELIRRCDTKIPIIDEKICTSSMDTCSQNWSTLIDHMISVYSGFYTTTDHPDCRIPVSWRVMGPPSIEAIGTVIIRILQAGARFTSASDSNRGTTCDRLSVVTHIDEMQKHLNLIDQQVDIIIYMRNLIYGRWLPCRIRNEILDEEDNYTEPNTTCPICLTEMEPGDNPVTLYCGHRFCVGCIKDYGRSKAQNQQITGRALISPADGRVMIYHDGGDKRCPICRRLICGDLLPFEHSTKFRIPRLSFGIDRHDAAQEGSFMTKGRGPSVLSDDQLRFECKALGKSQRGSRQDLIARLENIESLYMGSSSFQAPDGGSFDMNFEVDMKLELTAPAGMVMGRDNPTFIGAPRNGPVVIPIAVKGVPVLASLSHHSCVTVIPKCIVDALKLKTKTITSSQFVTVTGSSAVTVSAVVDEFKFMLDGRIEICLNNACVVHQQHECCFMSIQLGMDFFETALWTRSSVPFSEDGTSVVCDGNYTKNLLLRNQSSEFRYYSRDGKSARIPFVSITNMGSTNTFSIVGLPGNLSTQFAECQWCCRMFPCDGMVECKERKTFNRFYCDEDCKSHGISVFEEEQE